MKKIVVATNNKGKLEEIKEILTEYELLSLEEVGIKINVKEDENTFRGNALKKAKEVFKVTNIPCLADDSGLCINIFNNWPGVETARFLGDKASQEDRNKYILEKMKDKSGEERNAKVVCDIAYVDKNFKAVILRYFNPIGAHPCGLFGEENNGIPNNLMPYIVKVAKGELEYLRVFGNDYNTKDGTGVRDYIHVVDLAKAHIKAIKAFEFSKNINIYNIGTGTGYSVLEIINNFEKATGIKIPYKIVERRSGDIGENYSNSDKAKKELNFSTKYGILEMCKDAWNYEKNRG